MSSGYAEKTGFGPRAAVGFCPLVAFKLALSTTQRRVPPAAGGRKRATSFHGLLSRCPKLLFQVFAVRKNVVAADSEAVSIGVPRPFKLCFWAG